MTVTTNHLSAGAVSADTVALGQSSVPQEPSPQPPAGPDGAAPRFRLTPEESANVSVLLDDVLAETVGTPMELALERLYVRSHELPERLRGALTDFRVTGRPYGGCVISGLPLDESTAGPTPTSYSEEPDGTEVRKAGALLLMVGSLLGDPFSYLTQQQGRLVLDVFPVGGHEESQLGSSSTTTLEWHNEDAFHPMRADWIMLVCLRNHDGVATTFAPVQSLDLEPSTRELLHDQRFVIKPDESHTAQFNADTTGHAQDVRVSEAFDRVREMCDDPQRVPILTGDREAPYVRIDPAFMERDLDDPEAERALDEVITEFDGHMADVVLAPGEMLIIDNLRAVHGRRPFSARYDGTDRWLRRINVTADLRKSSGRRFGPHGRALI